MAETSPERFGKMRTGEGIRLRVRVFVGQRGSFDRQKQEASKNGVETIDPLHAGVGPAISSVSELSKKSLEYTVCTGLFAVGRDSAGRNLSFVTHQLPTENPGFIEEYKARIKSRLDEFVARVDPRTVDVGFFGGETTEVVSGSPDEERQRSKNAWYRSMQELMGQIVRESAGGEMRVVEGPGKPGSSASMLLDTERAELYIERE